MAAENYLTLVPWKSDANVTCEKLSFALKGLTIGAEQAVLLSMRVLQWMMEYLSRLGTQQLHEALCWSLTAVIPVSSSGGLSYQWDALLSCVCDSKP